MDFAYSDDALGRLDAGTTTDTYAAAASVAGDALATMSGRSKHLRVAFFSDAQPERNGAGSYYFDLIEQLRPQLGRVEMFQPALRHRRFGSLTLPLPGDPTQRLLTPNVPSIWRRLLAMQPDVIIAITPGPFGILGMALAKRLQCGFLNAFHTEFEALSRMYWNPLSRRIATGYLTSVNRMLCRSSHATLVHSTQMTATVARLGAETVSVMGTPLPARFIDTPVVPLRGPLRRCVFAGRLAAEKNLDLIVDAARALPDLEFVIAGDGPLRTTLERQSATLPNLSLTGWLDRGALCDLLDDADLLLLPSKLETFGSIALEAMARGRPAVVSESAGIHSWQSLRDGLISLPAGKPLAEVIADVRAQPLAFRRARAAHARAAAHRLHEDTLAHWRALLLRHATRP